uniref:Ciliary microtubule associated protein 1A n=1 Tax=Terrapene triunguis TaxID=2587831 RepID=A0A674JKK0_9SAUR
MGDSAWVGTWRPHRPRGPIMAHFTSPGPKYSIQGTTGDYSPEKSKKHVYESAPVIHTVHNYHGFPPPGPGAYTIPRVMGPNTVDKTASPCYSMKWKSKLGRFDEDLHKTPGPAAYKKTDVDVYKKRAPKYSMSSRTKPAGTVRHPGPGDYYPGKVRQRNLEGNLLESEDKQSQATGLVCI